MSILMWPIHWGLSRMFSGPRLLPKRGPAWNQRIPRKLEAQRGGDMYSGPHSRPSQVHKHRPGWSHLLWLLAALSVQWGEVRQHPWLTPHLPAADPGPSGSHHPLLTAPVISRALEAADSWVWAHPPWLHQMGGTVGAARA